MMSLEERTADNLKLIEIHAFWDDALAAFAATIDVNHYLMHGHSLRVGRYAAGMAEAMGMTAAEASEMRAAGYLHNIGMVTVDKHLADRTGGVRRIPGDGRAYRQGHRIVSTVQFPWPKIPEVVRSHHRRTDGSGYPDHL